jgi:membrane protein YdbS with pleckstrin-like domain
MEMDNLKDQWNNIRPGKADEQVLQEDNLRKIMAKKHNRMLLKIVIPEILIAGGYLFLVVFMLVFFAFFQGPWLFSLALAAIVLLLAIPAISLGSLYNYYRSGTLDAPIGTILTNLQRKGQFFLKIQYLLFALNILLLADLIVLVPLVYSEQLSWQSKITATAVGIILLLLLSSRLWKYYQKEIRSVNEFAQRLQ